MIVELNTGYQPPQPPVLDKKLAFKYFTRIRYNLRQLQRTRRFVEEQRELWVRYEQDAKLAGHLDALRLAREKIPAIDHWLATEYVELKKLYASNLLNLAQKIDGMATLDEKATLLGLSTFAARRALKPYGDHNEKKRESFTLLLTHMPESHADPDIEDPVIDEMIEMIMADPIAHRKTAQKTNELLGIEMPLPEVPKPTLVNSNPSHS